MRNLVGMSVLSVFLLAGGGAQADDRTVTLAVENMDCPTCAYIVKESLARVAGVSAVQLSMAGDRTVTATVTFDDAMVKVTALTAATADAGFPSQPIGGAE